MNFFKYIGVSREVFEEKYLQGGLVSESLHKEFPLNIFTYSRKCVHDNVWDEVTSKCRGIIVDRYTAEIIARPFEKFHNYGSSQGPNQIKWTHPTIIEKVDGFLCTAYRWSGKWYVASKGSFHSIHAKWATKELQDKTPYVEWPKGYTPVFEGVCRDLRIVVDYGKRSELVLLALINIETGEEMRPTELQENARIRGFKTPRIFEMELPEALDDCNRENVMNGEGYVLTWYHQGCPPTRLKLKYVEYLRLHRMVTGVSPKRIWEVLSQAHMKSELQDYLNNSTPWFNKFVTKWVNALKLEFDRVLQQSRYIYYTVKAGVDAHKVQFGFDNLGAERKMYALEFMKDANKEFAPVLFAMLDGKDESVVIWKQVKKMTTNGHPLVDIHTM